MGFFKILISCIIIGIFGYAAFIVFSFSLLNDDYIHLLKDSFTDSPSDGDFVGFKGIFDSSEKDVVSKYQSYPVIYYRLNYQRYVCRGSGDDRHCSWETYRTETEKTPFKLRVGDKGLTIENTGYVEYEPKNSAIFDHHGDNRVVQYVIKKSEPIYVWGRLEDGIVDRFEDYEHDRLVFIVTDNARQVLVDNISGVLYTQIGSSVIVIIMTIILFLVNNNWKEKSFVGGNLESYGKGAVFGFKQSSKKQESKPASKV
ncbi:hypothetical protein K9M79_09135 [Candidatus Woesearchaeota archaeon]|nr:hypothetical protein [Candidatus Woesearchaeota archaeon]